MNIFHKLGGLACVCAVAGAGVMLPVQTADACGMMMPPISYSTGGSSSLPANALGVHVSIQYQSDKATSKDFKVVRVDAKGKQSKESVSLQGTDKDYRRFLAFDRAAQPGDTFSIIYKDGIVRKLSVANDPLVPAQKLKLSVKVDKKGNATLTSSADKSTFSGMWNYNLHYQGEQASTSRSTRTYINLCKDTSEAVGWRELAVEVVPSNQLKLATMATIDVWVDCNKAKAATHPSISKASDDYFVPSVSVAGL